MTLKETPFLENNNLMRGNIVVITFYMGFNGANYAANYAALYAAIVLKQIGYYFTGPLRYVMSHVHT